MSYNYVDWLHDVVVLSICIFFPASNQGSLTIKERLKASSLDDDDELPLSHLNSPSKKKGWLNIDECANRLLKNFAMKYYSA